MKPVMTLAGAATAIALVGTSAVSADASLRRRRFGAFLLALTLAVGFNVTVAAPTPAQAASYVKVCAPKKCILVPPSKYCAPTKCKPVYREVPRGQYCAPSVGCFSYGGKNWTYNGSPRPTAAQKAALMKCLTALGATGLSGLVAPATGGASVTVFVFGVGSTLWGCT